MACSPTPVQETPEGAVRELVERLRHFDGSPADAEQLFEMLSKRGQQNLRSRAERYGAASGRKIAPSAMLVPARMVGRFSPRSYTSEGTGDYALVTVLGVGAAQRAEIPCVREEGLWRVDLVLPELPPLLIGPGREP